jgi:hypothetical protein
VEGTPEAVEESLDVADVARLARIRAEAMALSPAYMCWIEAGRSGPEPLVPADVRRRIRALMDEAARLGR